MAEASQADWKWYGYAGHFIGGKKCAFHLCTRIGLYLISTVGDYCPNGKRETLGASENSWFETFVFHCDGEKPSGDPNILDFMELDSERYEKSIEAERGHYRYCEKYAALSSGKGADDPQP